MLYAIENYSMCTPDADDYVLILLYSDANRRKTVCGAHPVVSRVKRAFLSIHGTFSALDFRPLSIMVSILS